MNKNQPLCSQGFPCQNVCFTNNCSNNPYICKLDECPCKHKKSCRYIRWDYVKDRSRIKIQNYKRVKNFIRNKSQLIKDKLKMKADEIIDFYNNQAVHIRQDIYDNQNLTGNDYFKLYNQLKERPITNLEIKFKKIQKYTLNLFQKIQNQLNRQQLKQIDQQFYDEELQPIQMLQVQRIKKLIHYKKLDISFQGIQERLQLLKFINLSSIQIFILSNNYIKSLNFMKSMRLSELKTLNLSSNNILNTHQLLILHTPVLRELNLSNNYIQSFKMFEYNKFYELEQLNISRNHIISLDYFQRAKLPKLKNLRLNDNRIQQIQPFKKLELISLQRLNLSNNFITCINAFQNVELPKLRHLSLNSNQISFFYPFKVYMSSINYCQLESNHFISSKVIKKIESMFESKKYK